MTALGSGRSLGGYARLMRLDRPVGTLLLLWPTLAALWMAAEGPPPPGILAIFVAGTFLARSAGCVANDIADRNFDGRVERTRRRPLPQGEVSLAEALALFALLGGAALGVALPLNALALGMAVAGGAIAVAYPFCKRWIALPQGALGVAFSWGVPMAFAAVRETVPAGAWLLFAASAAWVVAYDTLYAMVDREDDVAIGLKSAAILFGRADRALVAALQIAALGLFAWAGALLGFAHAYYGGLAAMAMLFVYQQRLIRQRRREACFKAFGNNVWAGFALFAGVALEYVGEATLT